MGRKAKNNMGSACCDQAMGLNERCCKVEAMVSIDERGQMVLPKELRDKVGIKAGDKLVVLSWQNSGEVCCISLIKTDYFMSVMSDMLGPMMNELASKRSDA